MEEAFGDERPNMRMGERQVHRPVRKAKRESSD